MTPDRARDHAKIKQIRNKSSTFVSDTCAISARAGAEDRPRAPPAAAARRSVEAAAEQGRQVVGAVQRGPGGRGSARRRYLARQLGREGGQPGRRRLAQRGVGELQQRLVRVALPRPATCRGQRSPTRGRGCPPRAPR